MSGVVTEAREAPFTVFLWGGKERFRRRQEILKVFTSTPIFSKSLVTTPSLARKDVWTRAVLQARELIAVKLQRGWSHTQFIESIRMLDDSLPVLPQFRSTNSNLVLICLLFLLLLRRARQTTFQRSNVTQWLRRLLYALFWKYPHYTVKS
jgi:hypothetical protein